MRAGFPMARRPGVARAHRGRDREGFALVAALWLLVALGSVGLQTALASRARRQAAANLLDEVRARAAVLAGTEYARSRLTAAMLGQVEELREDALSSARNSRDRRRVERSSVRSLFRRANPLEDPWREPQALIVPEMVFGDARYALLLRDVGAALNLNDASEEMLRLFFAQGMEVDYAEADQLAQAILDWRDEDEIPRLNGGEREEYLEDEALILPPNRDFVDIDELRHVRGMTPELFVRAAPHLTLIPDVDINLNSAPEPVLLALPGMDPGTAGEIIRLRDSGYLPRSDQELQYLVPSMGPILEMMGRDFTSRTTYTTDQVEILAQGWVDGGVVQVASRVVVRRGNTEAEVVWREVF
ncbi:MAG: type II secretion system protein GspK [Gemmatimonadota bacterium]